MAVAQGSLWPPLRRGGGGRASGCAPPGPLPPAGGGGAVNPQPRRGYRQLPAASGLRPRGSPGRGTTKRVVLGGGVGLLPYPGEQLSSLARSCSSRPAAARNRRLLGKRSSRSWALRCISPRYGQVLSAAPAQQLQFENPGSFFSLAEPGMNLYRAIRDSFSLHLTSPAGLCLKKDS